VLRKASDFQRNQRSKLLVEKAAEKGEQRMLTELKAARQGNDQVASSQPTVSLTEMKVAQLPVNHHGASSHPPIFYGG